MEHAGSEPRAQRHCLHAERGGQPVLRRIFRSGHIGRRGCGHARQRRAALPLLRMGRSLHQRLQPHSLSEHLAVGGLSICSSTGPRLAKTWHGHTGCSNTPYLLPGSAASNRRPGRLRAAPFEVPAGNQYSRRAKERAAGIETAARRDRDSGGISSLRTRCGKDRMEHISITLSIIIFSS